MSLILEALKKLDREKQAPDRGLVVVGPSAWPSASERRSAVGAGALVVGAVGLAGVGVAVWLLRGPARPAAPAQPAVAAIPSLAGPAAAAPARNAALSPSASGVAPVPPVAARPSAPAAGAPRVKAPRPVPAAEDFQLRAISAQNGQPVAVLNDRLVREGDTFDGVRVIRIGTDEVEIEVAGRRQVVKF